MNKKKNPLLSGPYLVWTAAFIIIPLILIVYYGLTSSEGTFTWANIMEIATPEVKISVNPKFSYLVEARVIDGKKYILVSADAGVELNGIAVDIRD